MFVAHFICIVSLFKALGWIHETHKGSKEYRSFLILRKIDPIFRLNTHGFAKATHPVSDFIIIGFLVLLDKARLIMRPAFLKADPDHPLLRKGTSKSLVESILVFKIRAIFPKPSYPMLDFDKGVSKMPVR